MAHVKKPVALALTAVILMAAALMIFMHSVRVSALEDKIEVGVFPQTKVELGADDMAKINLDDFINEESYVDDGTVRTYKYMDFEVSVGKVRAIAFTLNAPAGYTVNTPVAFRVEPIKWTRIGTTNRYIADSVIYAAAYDNEGESTWADSSLNSWLINDFKAKSQIANDQTYKVGDVTLATKLLAVGLTAKTASPTDYAKAVGASDGSWWLADNSVAENAYLVSESGDIGADADTPVVSIHGVRPIITLNDGTSSDIDINNTTTTTANAGTVTTTTFAVITTSTTAAPTTAETTTTTPEPMSQTGEFGAIAVAGLMIAAGAIFAKAHKKNKDEDDD